MKKQLTRIIAGILVISAMLSTASAASSAEISSTVVAQETTYNTNESETTNSSVVIETEGLDEETAAARKQEAEVALASIDQKLLNNFAEGGFKIVLMDEASYKSTWLLNWKQETKSIACYSHYRKEILSTRTTVDTLSHELGHHLFAVTGNETEYMPIYQAETEGICTAAKSQYGKTSFQEGFAEAYSVYVMEPEVLKANAPKNYEYIQTLLSRLEG